MKEVKLTTPEQPCFIGAWYLPDISLCDEIINTYNTNAFRTAPGTIGPKTENIIDTKVKDSIDSTLYDVPNLANKFTSNLLTVLEQYKKNFPVINEVDSFFLDSLNIQKYSKGAGYYAWHSERMGANFRHLVWMTYLNDIAEGGETEFYYQKLKVKPRKGLTLIWPVDWTHTHRGIVAPNEEKMILTGWFSFAQPQVNLEAA